MILDSDLTINDRLTLTSGVFATSSSSEVITISSTGIIVGASSTNYFDGPLEIQNLSSAYTFHSGDGSKYRPALITPSSAMDITVEFLDSTPPNNTSVGSGLSTHMAEFYWEVKRASGSGNVAVELFYKESTSGSTPDNDEILDGDYLRFIQYDNGTTTWEDLGLDARNSDLANLSSITGTITAFKGTNDYYTIGSDITATLLPVDLVSFEGQVENQSVHLHWITASETNNDRFEIEYSVSGNEFFKIGEVAGSGTINEMKSYDFTHSNPVKGSNYYRLKQVDFDGQYEYSSVVYVIHQGFEDSFTLLENPTSGILRFHISSRCHSID